MSKKMLKLTRPAYIALVAYLVFLVTILLPFNISPALDEETSKMISMEYNFGQRLVVVLLMLLPIAFSVYSINCFIVGNCFTWSYVHAVLVVVWVMLFILSIVLASTGTQEQTN
jgi:hypothetical protein